MSIYSRGDRRLPVRPDLEQLKHQAKDLLRALKRGDPVAIEEFNQFHPKPVSPDEAKLADTQLALARSYHTSSWPRLVQACNLIDAIWKDDSKTVLDLITKNRRLLFELAGIRNSNWGPPMSYAANLGRNEIIKMLADAGATDFAHALDRAAL